MGNIDVYLAQILSAKYGEEVRGSIHDAIQQSYTDIEQASSDVESAAESVAEAKRLALYDKEIITQYVADTIPEVSVPNDEIIHIGAYDSTKNGWLVDPPDFGKFKVGPRGDGFAYKFTAYPASKALTISHIYALFYDSQENELGVFHILSVEAENVSLARNAIYTSDIFQIAVPSGSTSAVVRILDENGDHLSDSDFIMSGSWYGRQRMLPVYGLAVKSYQGSANAGKALVVGDDGLVTTGEAGVAVDPTLSIAGMAADAKAAGDGINELKSAFDSIMHNSANLLNPQTVLADSYIDGQGAVQPNNGTWLSDKIVCPSGATHVIVSYYNSQNVKQLITSSTFRICFYSDSTYLGRDTSSDVDLVSGTNYIRIYLSNTFPPERCMVEFGDTMSGKFVPYSYSINPDAIELDNTLTRAGYPADAKSTGDKLNEFEEEINGFYSQSAEIGTNLFNPYDVTLNSALNASTGEIVSGTGCVSQYMEIPDGATDATELYMASNGTIIIATAAGRIDCFYYDTNKNFLSPRQFGHHNIPTGAKYVRLSIAASYAASRWSIMYGTGNLSEFAAYNNTVITVDKTAGKRFSLVEYLSTHPNTVVKMLGDSITQGVGGTGFAQDGDTIFTYGSTSWAVNTAGVCWANMLKDKLSTLYGVTCINWGTRGVSTDDYWAYDLMVQSLIKDTDDVVIIMLGTNDRNDSKYQNAEVGKQRFKSNLQAILQYILDRGKKVICISPIPATPAADVESGVLFTSNTVNSIVTNVCEQMGVQYVDLFKAFVNWINLTGADYASYFADTLHPNDHGYKLMYYLISRELNIPNDLTFSLN